MLRQHTSRKSRLLLLLQLSMTMTWAINHQQQMKLLYLMKHQQNHHHPLITRPQMTRMTLLYLKIHQRSLKRSSRKWSF